METFQTWIRLHPDATDDTMVTAVQARMHDPLWLLGRQWQFGELSHDAGATPVTVRVEGVVSPLTRLRGGAAAPIASGTVAIRTAQVPLETLVEREAVPESGLDNLRLRTEAGLHLLRLLRAAGLGHRGSFWADQSRFAPPAADEDAAVHDWFLLVSGRVPDGADLPRAIRQHLSPPEGTAPADPAEATVLRAWLSWSAGRFDRPGGGPATWDDEHLEYAFAAGGLKAEGEAVLVAPEYRDGRLEWYDFEESAGTLGVSGQPTPRRAFRIPAPLDFAGMPNPRFWTFEDPAVRFDTADILASSDEEPSPAALMVLDFALSYSDDWFLVPLKLEAWTVFEATTVAITDVFGETTSASPPGGRWNLFRLDVHDTAGALSRLFLTACPIETQEGDPLEEVHFLRDEDANVAWAIERIAPHPLGAGRLVPEPPPDKRPATPSGLRWTLTPPSPPGNWFPLLPTEVGRLALGTVWSARTQKPAGRLLAGLRTPRRLHQEEVPREGVQVTRRWQSARAADGSLHFWIGRSKTPRQTEIAPAVRFDVVES